MLTMACIATIAVQTVWSLSWLTAIIIFHAQCNRSLGECSGGLALAFFWFLPEMLLGPLTIGAATYLLFRSNDHVTK